VNITTESENSTADDGSGKHLTRGCYLLALLKGKGAERDRPEEEHELQRNAAKVEP
jgi:hypothetical protein